MLEPRDPLLKVFSYYFVRSDDMDDGFGFASNGRSSPPGAFIPPGARAAVGRGPAKETVVGSQGMGGSGRWDPRSVMILPQVHLRKPCYDFYFL